MAQGLVATNGAMAQGFLAIQESMATLQEKVDAIDVKIDDMLRNTALKNLKEDVYMVRQGLLSLRATVMGAKTKPGSLK